jgi:hypothetical protein
MAVSYGAVHSVRTLEGYAGATDTIQVAAVQFTIATTYTYAQADDGELSDVDDLIQDSRRNGKTVTLVDAMPGHHARKLSGNTIMSLKTVAVSTAAITFEVTDGDETTEYADSTAMVAQSTPFEVLVAFTEA